MEQPSPGEIRAALDRLLADARFSRSYILRRLLEFTVQRTLEGKQGDLKEAVLGGEALGRGSAFDPRSDPVVRVNMLRIRAKLDEYYAAEGRGENVRIEYPKGSYVPAFVRAAAAQPVAPVPAVAEVPIPTAAPKRSRRLLWAGASAAVALSGFAWLYASRSDPAATARKKAEEAYRLGLYLRMKEKADLYPQAEAAFAQAVQLDPEHRRAQVALAKTRLTTSADPASALEQARIAANQVLAADHSVAEAYELRSYLRRYHDYDWDGALDDARQSLRWAPESDWSYAALGGTLQTLGRLEEALPPLRRAAELAPSVENHWHNLADHYWRMGRTADALREIRRLIAVTAEALEEFEKVPLPQDPHLAAAFWKLGRKGEARKSISAFEFEDDRMFRHLASIGDVERAFERLERAASARSSWVPGFLTNPEADPLRANPKFHRLYRKIGLPR